MPQDATRPFDQRLDEYRCVKVVYVIFINNRVIKAAERIRDTLWQLGPTMVKQPCQHQSEASGDHRNRAEDYFLATLLGMLRRPRLRRLGNFSCTCSRSGHVQRGFKELIE